MGLATAYQRGVGMSDYAYPPGVNVPSDEALLFCAVFRAMPVRKVRNGVPLWQAVMDTFQVGATAAHALCERFRLDPEQKTQR